MKNLFDIPSVAKGEEAITVLHEDGHIRIERIVSHDAKSPDGFWYDQNEDEWVSVLQGEAKLEMEDQIITLHQGDQIFLPSHRKHRIVSTGNCCIWLCVFVKKNQK